MLILQKVQSKTQGGQGCHAAVFAELQVKAVSPRIPDGNHRQRLLELSARLARVQALGDEYARVDFSPQAAQQLERETA